MSSAVECSIASGRERKIIDEVVYGLHYKVTVILKSSCPGQTRALVNEHLRNLNTDGLLRLASSTVAREDLIERSRTVRTVVCFA